MPDSVPTLPFIRPDEKLLSFELINLKNNTLNQTDEHHRHDFYSVVLLTEGTTEQVVDFKTYSVSAGEVLIIPKGSVHFGDFDKNLEGYFLLFTADFFDTSFSPTWQHLTIFNPLYESAVIKPAEKDFITVSQIAGLLSGEYISLTSALDNKVLQHLLLAFLLKLEDANKNSLQLKPTPNDSYYQNFLYLLDTNFMKEHSVGFYALQLNITTKKLSGLLTGKCGKSTADLITERLLLEAKRLLTYSPGSVKEIAYNLGFEDPFYFSRLFKKQTGTSPEQFRQQLSQKSI
jgi:AraC-like DNA-binding protein